MTAIPIDETMYPKICWIKKSRLFNTSLELMEELYKALGEFSFVKNLAIVVRGARSGAPTFSLIFFWYPKFLDGGYVSLVSNKPLDTIKGHLSVIRGQGDLTGYFDVVLLKVHLVARQSDD